MKKTMELAGITAAAVIGAGFATGREVKTYFTKYGNLSYFIIAGVAVLLYFGVLLLLKDGTRPGKIPTALYVYFGYMLMLAALGQLIKEYTGLPSFLGVIVGGIISLMALGAGFGRFIKFSGILTPLVAVALVLLLAQTGVRPLSEFSGTREGLFFSVLNFTGYNFLSMVVVIPEVKHRYKRKEKIFGGAIGVLLPILCMFVINEKFLRNYLDIEKSQMPLISIICDYGKQSLSLIAVSFLTIIFLLSICGSLVGLSRMVASGKKEFKVGVLFLVGAVPFSLFGFGKLMDRIYPVFGLLGMFLYVWVVFLSLTSYGKKLIL